ncbi:MAG: PH domain-containing protein [Rhodothermaceae bacterium]|nr:PH domain-containing protein [Rhodothermaceae bacterium]MYD20263.1 PH domain-containing protein [Rhodothermaceae bacterium]MYJ55531.1 PH domain-containing protein [Rhodothermaceae bacterium]
MQEASAEFRRLHPLTFVHYVFLAIIGFVIAWTTSPESGIQRGSLIFSVIYVVIMGPISIAKYLRFRYYVTSEELVMHYGVFKRIRRNIPSDRVQNVAIERNFLSRILGTAVVKIETAGTAQAEGVLSYVGVHEANRIRDLLRTAEITYAPDESIPASPDFRMRLPRLLLSSVYQFSFGLFAILVGVLQQLEAIGLINIEATLRDIFERNFFGPANSEQYSLVMLTIAFILITLILSWILGFAQNFIRYYNFYIELGPEKIHRKFGLITVREGTLPYKRVQSFLIRSNPLMRLHDWYRMEMQTLGLESGERGFQPAMPFAKWAEILALGPKIRHFTAPEAYTRVSRRTIRRRCLRYALLILAPVAALYLWWPYAVWGLTLLPISWGIAWLQYLCHSWSFHDGNLFIRRRIFSQQLWVVPIERLQAFEINATFFQRRLDLCTLRVDTAGAGVLRHPKIVDMRRDDAEKLFAELYDVFQGTASKSNK